MHFHLIKTRLDTPPPWSIGRQIPKKNQTPEGEKEIFLRSPTGNLSSGIRNVQEVALT